MSNTVRHDAVATYASCVPKLWNDTIDAHRHQVREAILATTASLVEEHGLRAVTMSQIAEQTGIGRATLYKYFPDVETILHAWHEQQIHGHLHDLSAVASQHTDPSQRLAAVLGAYASIAQQLRGQRDTELAALLHADQQVTAAEHHLHGMLTGLIGEAAAVGAIRDDVPPAELASFCLHALSAAGSLASKAAVRRLIEVTLAGLRPE
jgi:AcrR family transcriptional regulator